MPLWFRIILSLAGVGVVAFGAFYIYVAYFFVLGPMDLSGAVHKEYDLRSEMMSDLDTPQCLTRDDVLDYADRRGWTVQDVDPPAQCHTPTGLTDWLRVSVNSTPTPQDPPEETTFFGFSDQNCSTYWYENTGEGTTCP